MNDLSLGSRSTVNDYEEDANETIGAPTYLQEGVRPNSIHRSKKDHRKALFDLASSIDECLEDSSSAKVEVELLYEIALEEAAEIYEGGGNTGQEQVSVGLSQVLLTEGQAERLAEESSLEYKDSKDPYIDVPVGEVEGWTEETVGQFNS